MKHRRILFQLVPSMPRTDGIESSLWHTPDASVTTGGAANAKDRKEQGHAIGLHDQVNTPAMWPTPTGRDHKDGSAKSCENVPVNALLGRAVHLWPTPQSGANNPAAHNAMSGDFKTRFAERAGIPVTGQLYPDWVELLMGFPRGWTELGEKDGKMMSPGLRQELGIEWTDLERSETP